MGEVLELRGITGYVVDDKVRYQFMRLAESLHVIPITQARVDLGVICGIETSIGSIDGMKKRQQVHAAEGTAEGAVQQFSQVAEIAGQTIDVRDELDLILQRRTPCSQGRASGIGNPARTLSSV
jgi:hypothetical protein